MVSFLFWLLQWLWSLAGLPRPELPDILEDIVGDAPVVSGFDQSFCGLLESLKEIIKRVMVIRQSPLSYFNSLATGKRRVLGIVTSGGAEGIRTPYLRDANAALSQMSYSPKTTIL
jgi:hypothetical protein